MKIRLPRPVLDMLDRAGRSTLQQFVVVAFSAIPAINTVSRIPWYAALATGLGAGVVSLLTSLVSWKVPTLTFWPDIIVRVGKTFAQSLLATLGAGVINLFSVPWVHALDMAIGAAALSLLTGLIATGVHPGIGIEPSASLVYSSPTDEALAKVDAGVATLVDEPLAQEALEVVDPNTVPPPV